ncbi:MAG TPA: LptF/LptG family permease [Tepidisphaeraceae bacterium]|jgi:lipopolysaccharide export LptBFGC system permease protein LptF|nr:LptF/LptG family permease [Tepidisphaeraceae bacterium]
MSRTLFAYIFKDLLRIFMMASGALAGIMSFGGLLRPLTREGLDAGQVARMLAYFGPAMTTYSFPVAALFATAVVYGRLSADNELTACKAGGISLLSLTVSGPALMLGLIVAIVSLLFLCFIVPASTLKVEKVIYSNLAKLVQSRIERTHEIDLQQSTIFAEEAHVIPPDKNTPPGQQRVELIGAEVISTDHDPEDKTLIIPKEFYTASRAYVYIDPQADGQTVHVTVNLMAGFKFPRRYKGATEAGIEDLVYGPTQIPSPIKEDVKFMNIQQLKSLYKDVSQSGRLKLDISEFVKNWQKMSFLQEMERDLNGLNGPKRQTLFSFGSGGSYSLSMEGEGYAATINGEEVAPFRRVAKGGATTQPAGATTAPATTAAAVAGTQPVQRTIVYREEKEGHDPFVVKGADAVVRVTPNPDSGMMQVRIELNDCVQTMKGTDGVTDMPVESKKFTQQFEVPMNAEQKAMAGKSIDFYESKEAAKYGNQLILRHDKAQLINAIIAESNGRASFAISCLILVMVGSALGMMFRSGNFLTAFAVSFVPALLSITLIIAGQRTAANLPLKFDAGNNPLKLGLSLIWTGNAINLLLAIGLLWKLGRR